MPLADQPESQWGETLADDLDGEPPAEAMQLAEMEDIGGAPIEQQGEDGAGEDVQEATMKILGITNYDLAVPAFARVVEWAAMYERSHEAHLEVNPLDQNKQARLNKMAEDREEKKKKKKDAKKKKKKDAKKKCKSSFKKKGRSVSMPAMTHAIPDDMPAGAVRPIDGLSGKFNYQVKSQNGACIEADRFW